MGVKLISANFENEGKKITYQYTIDRSISKYFKASNPFYVEYDIDVSETPCSIAIIPFLSNIMPIAWFVGFDVYIDEVDETFAKSIQNLKEEFSKYYKVAPTGGNLKINKLIQHEIKGGETALLFSGGLDSFESFIRNKDKNPYLISIHGADVEIEDSKRWNSFKKFNQEEKILDANRHHYIESNLRDFYTYHIELLVNIGWWGKVQHGMALLGVLAPLCYLKGVESILIGSSNTEEVEFGWGSTPGIDEKMKWANSHVIHDGYHLRRTEKIEKVVEFVEQGNPELKLRVCYSELRDGYNCSHCAKCQRTMFGIIMANDDPVKYGFNVPDYLYELILDNFKSKKTLSKGLEYEWRCLQEKAKEINTFFVLKDKEKEQAYIDNFVNINLKEQIDTAIDQPNKGEITKFILRNKFSGVYALYKKIRYNR